MQQKGRLNKKIAKLQNVINELQGKCLITLWCLIDVPPPPPPPLINFSKIFHPGHSYSNPPGY